MPRESRSAVVLENIFEKSSNANPESSWLSHLKENDIDVDSVVPKITVDIFMEILCNLRNWASPGPDGVQGFWWNVYHLPTIFCVQCSISSSLVTMSYQHGFQLGKLD